MIEDRVDDETRARLIRAAVKTYGFDEETARFVVALELGEIDGDIVSSAGRPFTPEERRRMGLDPDGATARDGSAPVLPLPRARELSR